jgi:hypothetical protein
MGERLRAVPSKPRPRTVMTPDRVLIACQRQMANDRSPFFSWAASPNCRICPDIPHCSVPPDASRQVPCARHGLDVIWNASAGSPGELGAKTIIVALPFLRPSGSCGASHGRLMAVWAVLLVGLLSAVLSNWRLGGQWQRLRPATASGRCGADEHKDGAIRHGWY